MLEVVDEFLWRQLDSVETGVCSYGPVRPGCGGVES
jgi:hypothetical protein